MDFRLALMMQNQEFLELLKRDTDFMKTLERGMNCDLNLFTILHPASKKEQIIMTHFFLFYREIKCGSI